MATQISDYPVQEVQFTKSGDVFDAEEVEALATMIGTENLTDLLVLSHGWNNDMDEARGLYRDWLAGLASAPTTTSELGERRIGVLEVLWPSKKFADPDETAGGAAALVDAQGGLIQQLTSLEGIDGAGEVPRLQQLVPKLEESKSARDDFVRTLVGLLGDHESLDDENKVEVPSGLFDASGSLLRDLAGVSFLGAGEGGSPPGDVVGGAAGLGDVLGGVLAGARNLLNYVTYYTMKARAGDVGRKGLAPVLARVHSDAMRVHLVGHSFGCRLSAAALLGTAGEPDPQANSMVLLQAAFSHFGFSGDYDGARSVGYFRPVVATRRVSGPIVVSFSEHDRAVGLAYALASRIAHQVASAIGGPSDPFGGMGRNGALKTNEANLTDMLPVGDTYADLHQDVVLNVDARQFIGGHSQVRGPEVAELIAQTIAATG